MRNYLFFYIKNIKNMRIEEKDFFVIYYLIYFLLKNRKNFFLETSVFLKKINFFLKKIKSKNLRDLINFFLKNESLKVKSIYVFYDKIFIFLLILLKLKKKEIFLLNVSKKLDKKDLKILEKNFFEFVKGSFLVIQKIEPEIYSGFQIYLNEERNDFSWRGIFNKLLKKIEINYFEEN